MLLSTRRIQGLCLVVGTGLFLFLFLSQPVWKQLLGLNFHPTPFFDRALLYTLSLTDPLQSQRVQSRISPTREVSKVLHHELYQHALYASAIYCNKQQVQNWTCGAKCPSAFILHHYEENATMGLAAYVGYQVNSPEQSDIVVAFRGSSDFHTWMYDLKFAQLNYTIEPGREAKVHGGFYRCYRALQPGIQEALTTLVARIQQEQHLLHQLSIILTGHSLGGALALFQYIDLLQRPWLTDNELGKYQWTSKIQWSATLTTFGEPRVGNRAFATWVYELEWNRTHLDHNVHSPTTVPVTLMSSDTNPKLQKVRTHRVTSGNDLIPTLPPTLLGFYHHPHEYWVSYGVNGHLTRLYECPDVRKPGNSSTLYESPWCSQAQPIP
ncbi:hypothetical protein IWQ61_004877, partial [Dispira simplex]